MAWRRRRRRGAYYSACGRRRAACDPAHGQRRAAACDPGRGDLGNARHSRPARRRVRRGWSRRRRLDHRAGHRFGGDRAARHRSHAQRPAGDTPADWVTLTRTLLIAVVAGLVADSFSRPVSITALVTLSSVALALDAADGQVARRTGTVTPLGARIDGEVDAFLILLLSIAVSQHYGSWVLVIGAARYVLLLAGWLIPWLAAPLPSRYWRKVVAAIQGIVLTVAVSGVPDRRTGTIAVVAALLLLAESFGRDVIWLYRTGASPRTRRALRLTITALSVVLVLGVLVAPDRMYQLTPAAFARIPVEWLPLVLSRWCCRPGRGGSWPRSLDPVRPDRSPQDHQHGVLRRGRSGVQPGTRLGRHLPGHQRGARHNRHRAHRHRTRRGLARSHPGHRRDHRRNDSHHHRGRPASPRRGPRHSPPSPRSGRCARACHCNSSPDSRSPRPAPRGWSSRRSATPSKRSATSAVSSRPSTAPTLKPASPLRTCSPDCAARTSSSTSSKATGRSPSRAPASPPASMLSCARAPPHWPAPAGPRRAPGSPPRPTAGSAGSPTPPCSRGCGLTAEQRYAELTSSHRFTLSDAFEKAGWRTVSDVPEDYLPGHPATPFTTRQALQPAQRRLPRPDLQLRLDARPVHLRRVPAARIHPWS